MREYDRDAAESYWIVLDVVAATDVVFEIAVEMAAALVARAARSGERVGASIGAVRVPAAPDGTSLDAALDALARVERVEQGALALPAAPGDCVIVSARDISPANYADVYRAMAETVV
jgi:uncharacterized protein (DUF58 family)